MDDRHNEAGKLLRLCEEGGVAGVEEAEGAGGGGGC